MNSNGDGINEDVSYTLNRTDVDAIAFHARQDPCPSVEVVGAIDTDPTSRAFAFSAGQSEGAGTLGYQEEQSPTLRGASSGTNQVPAMMSGMQVRRLTPVECARLQGFPDDYLDIEYRGKPAADGPKYKALGNSMAVPCMRWIGERIQAVTRLRESDSATNRVQP